MNVAQVIAERLMADGAITAYVGSRVYMVKLPQALTTTQFPAIRVQLIDQPQGYHLRGEHGATAARVQVDVYASEATGGNPYLAADAAAEAVKDSLSGQRFTDLGSPSTIDVTACFLVDRREGYDPDERRLVRIMQDFIVWSRNL